MPRLGYSADISRSSVIAISAFCFGARCADSPAAVASVPAATAEKKRRRVMAGIATSHYAREVAAEPAHSVPHRRRTAMNRSLVLGFALGVLATLAVVYGFAPAPPIVCAAPDAPTPA